MSRKSGDKTSARSAQHQAVRQIEPHETVSDPHREMLDLQHAAGNRAVGNLINSSAPPQDAGKPLDPGLRTTMEDRFGHDFGGVRVHTDSKATESAQAVDTRAYTVGNHIFFDAGHYAPNQSTGRHLLAHELAHVIQQTRGGSTPEINPSAAHEQDASAAASAAVGGSGPVNVQAATGVGIAMAPATMRKYNRWLRRWRGRPGNQGKVPPSFQEWARQRIGFGQYGGGAMRRHHRIPQEIFKNPRNAQIARQLESQLARHNVTLEKFIHDSVIDIPEEVHKRLHQGRGGGRWNREIIRWMRERPNFTLDQLRNKINSMTADSRYGIPKRYRTPGPSYAEGKPGQTQRRTPDDHRERRERKQRRRAERRERRRQKKSARRKDLRKRGKARVRGRAGTKAATRSGTKAARSRARRQIARIARARAFRRRAMRVASRIGLRAAGRFLGKMAMKIATRGIPIVGWVLLAIDIAELSFGIYRIAKYGAGPGGTEPPGPENQGQQQGAESEGQGSGEGSGGEHEGGTREGDLAGEVGEGSGDFPIGDEMQAIVDELPLSEQTIELLRQSTPQQQALLEMMLDRVSEPGQPAADENFFQELLQITADMTPEELETMQSMVQPVQGENTQSILQRLREALQSARGKKTGKANGEPSKSAQPAKQTDQESEPKQEGGAVDNTKQGKGKQGSGGGSGSGGKGKGENKQKSEQGNSTAGATPVEAQIVTEPQDFSGSTFYEFLILEGFKPNKTYQQGQVVKNTIRFSHEGGQYVARGIRMRFERRIDRPLKNGQKRTSFVLTMLDDWQVPDIGFNSKGGTVTEYNFTVPQRRRRR